MKHKERIGLLAGKDGRPREGSVSEKRWVDINGFEQGMFIRSRDVRNPVLLFLHGGPGMPEIFLERRYPTGLEEAFTVCWWERRGAGLSYRPDIPPETMTVEQVIADTLEVARYLRRRFGQEKVYLMAHSGGTFFGIQAAARAPELFHAYVGVSQMAYQLRSEVESYEYMVRKFRENRNARMARKLEAAPPTMATPLPDQYMRLRDQAMHSLGVGTTHEMRSVFTGIFLPVWMSGEYTIGERRNIWRGKTFSAGMLWNEMISTDLPSRLTELSIPVYLCSGAFDRTVSRTLSRSYFDKLRTPLKGFYCFQRSAHSPMFEEPEKMMKILTEDVLRGRNDLADVR